MGHAPDRTTTRAISKRQHFEDSVEVITEQFASWSRWLNGSLFAVNGAGLVAVAQSFGEVPVNTKTALPFALGLVFALISAALIQEYYQRSLPIIRKFRDYWRAVEYGQERNLRFEVKLKKIYNQLDKWAWIPPVFGWSSGISFVVGLWQFSAYLGG